MGQRLVVQIINDGEVLANAYYHWSAYTGSSAEMVDNILEFMKEVNPDYTDFQKAVWLLYKTGARFNATEAYWIGKQEFEKEPIEFVFDGKRVDRNDGLLCISERGKKENMTWAERVVSIDLTRKEIDFQVLIELSQDEYNEESVFPPIDTLRTYELPEDQIFSFEEWPKFSELITTLLNESNYWFSTPDHSIVYMLIE